MCVRECVCAGVLPPPSPSDFSQPAEEEQLCTAAGQHLQVNLWEFSSVFKFHQLAFSLVDVFVPQEDEAAALAHCCRLSLRLPAER